MKIVFSRNMPVEKKAARARVIVNAPAEQQKAPVERHTNV